MSNDKRKIKNLKERLRRSRARISDLNVLVNELEGTREQIQSELDDVGNELSKALDARDVAYAREAEAEDELCCLGVDTSPVTKQLLDEWGIDPEDEENS